MQQRIFQTMYPPEEDENEPSVSSYNEWDPLEEIIVGSLEGAHVPEWHIALDATMPQENKFFFIQNGGKRFPEEHLDLAKQELDDFASLLEKNGIIVKRPVQIDHGREFSTPNWRSAGGLYSAMPRDILLIIGDTIIESPLAWRSRYFEIDAYRPLLKDYFRRGAKWISAPKPQLVDQHYNANFDKNNPVKTSNFAVTEFEPTFDAADFIRCGKDIFVQKSHVTNQFGIDWIRRHIDKEYNIHLIEIDDPSPMHIDASFMPLVPGKLLLNPDKIAKIPNMFKDWEIKYAPRPAIPSDHKLYMSSAWISMNILMLDQKRVVVESQEEPIAELLTKWNFEVIPIDFRNVMRFGGAFHCVTCDIRRKGTLQSYFNR